MVNKHKAIHDWVGACPLLAEPLHFDFLAERHGSVSLSPTANDIFVKRYMRSCSVREYRFELQAMLAVSSSTDDTNTANMQLLDTWVNWLEEQQKLLNFPDFGPDCSDYCILPLENMPTQAMRHESGFAKYIIPVTVQYYEENW